MSKSKMFAVTLAVFSLVSSVPLQVVAADDTDFSEPVFLEDISEENSEDSFFNYAEGVNAYATSAPAYTKWLQTDKRWASIMLCKANDNPSVGRIGCTATSVCVQLAHSGVCSEDESVFNPKIGINALIDAGAFDAQAYISYGVVTKVYPDFKYVSKVSLKGTQAEKQKKIQEYYNKGYYMIVSCNTKGGEKTNHYVSVRTCQNNKVYIFDTGGFGATDFSKFAITGELILYSAPKPSYWRDSQINVKFHRNLNSSDTMSVSETFTASLTNQKFGYTADGKARYNTMNDASTGFGNWSKPGYVFLGWSEDPNATTAKYKAYNGVSANWVNTNSPSVDLYGVWKQGIKSVEIENAASKDTYWLYEELDTSGLSLKVTNSDGTTKTIDTGFTVSADMTKTGTVPVTVSYTEDSLTQTTSYNIKVKHPFKGTGSESDPYLIQNSDDLVRLAKVINGPYVYTSDGEKKGYNFLYYKQTEDIDMKDISFKPIGVYYKDYSNIDITDNLTGDNDFHGVYDGDNHTVSNLSIKDYKHCYCGMFGRITNAVVRNLAVTGEIISTNICTGGIIGEAGYNSTVTGCSFNGKVEGAGSTGGVVGCFFTGGKISDCYANADVIDISDDGNNGSGGITGRISVGTRTSSLSVDALIENCYFTGNVSGKNAGAISGVRVVGTEQAGRKITVRNVYTDSEIKSSDDTGVTFIDSSNLKALDGLTSSHFVKNTGNLNNGYPVFEWQKSYSAPDSPETPEPSEIITGDLNFDGKVDITDLSNLSLALVGDIILSEEQKKAADITKDGEVSLTDLARLRQYISKVIETI